MLNSNLIEGVIDPREIDQSLVAWDYLISQDKLRMTVILQTHHLIMVNIWPEIAGEIRTCDVMVGGRVCPPKNAVSDLLVAWVDSMISWQDIDPIVAHVGFERIHPFRDGNGRTGRMLMWWHETKLGLLPTIIKYENRHEYYNWFK